MWLLLKPPTSCTSRSYLGYEEQDKCKGNQGTSYLFPQPCAMPRCEESRPCLPLSMPDQRCWTQQLCMWDPSRFICIYIYYMHSICDPIFCKWRLQPFLLGFPPRTSPPAHPVLANLLLAGTSPWRILAEVFVADIAGKIVWLMDFPIMLNLDYHQI